MPTLQALLSAAVVRDGHRKVTMTCGGATLTLPITSPKVQHSNLEADWRQIPRPGQKPFLGKAGGKLRQIRFDVILIPYAGFDVSYRIEWLKRMANSDAVVTIAYGHPEVGAWRCTTLEIGTERRALHSNNPTQATASLTFTESIPLPAPTATHPATKTTNKSTKAKSQSSKARIYTVKSGDTLSGIALHFYHDANEWPKIAKANHLRNPNLIYPGQKLIIP